MGCGSPVVKVSDHGKYVMSSSPVPLKTRRLWQYKAVIAGDFSPRPSATEDLLCRGADEHYSCRGSKSPPIDTVWPFGEEGATTSCILLLT
ncbi:hypothetical protein TNCV_860811 [Trichonephila clavipes]|nr:hypothetical protein TNCV_860811 [Trichonephila clavipes]